MTTSDKWRQVKALFEVTRARPMTECAKFDEACAGDQTMRKDVESMLAAHESTKDFLSQPTSQLFAGMLSEDRRELQAGQHVGPYKILSTLGTGGMGEVYHAWDPKLDRPVAIKVLSSTVGSDADGLARFRAEARAISSLNHPHVLVIHDIGEIDGRPFIVTELVEGQTLAARLNV